MKTQLKNKSIKELEKIKSEISRDRKEIPIS